MVGLTILVKSHLKSGNIDMTQREPDNNEKMGGLGRDMGRIALRVDCNSECSSLSNDSGKYHFSTLVVHPNGEEKDAVHAKPPTVIFIPCLTPEPLAPKARPASTTHSPDTTQPPLAPFASNVVWAAGLQPLRQLQKQVAVEAPRQKTGLTNANDTPYPRTPQPLSPLAANTNRGELEQLGLGDTSTPVSFQGYLPASPPLSVSTVGFQSPTTATADADLLLALSGDRPNQSAHHRRTKSAATTTAKYSVGNVMATSPRTTVPTATFSSSWSDSTAGSLQQGGGAISQQSTDTRSRQEQFSRAAGQRAIRVFVREEWKYRLCRVATPAIRRRLVKTEEPQAVLKRSAAGCLT